MKHRKRQKKNKYTSNTETFKAIEINYKDNLGRQQNVNTRYTELLSRLAGSVSMGGDAVKEEWGLYT